MRDAFGGVFMMRLMLVFIVVFVGFGAISLNYAKAFRIKNKVIDLLEQQQIFRVTDILTSSKNYTDKLDKIIDNADYRINCDDSGKKEVTYKNDKGQVTAICYRGITIINKSTKVNGEHENSDSVYLEVVTYGGWNLGFLNMILALGDRNQDSEERMSGRWKVSGEAKVSGLPFSDTFSDGNNKRCNLDTRKEVTVVKCQPKEARGGKCLLNDGTYVLRRRLGNC